MSRFEAQRQRGHREKQREKSFCLEIESVDSARDLSITFDLMGAFFSAKTRSHPTVRPRRDAEGLSDRRFSGAPTAAFLFDPIQMKDIPGWVGALRLCAFAWVGGRVGSAFFRAGGFGVSAVERCLFRALSTATGVAEMAGRAAVLLEISLVVLLGSPEGRRLLDHGDDRSREGAGLFEPPFAFVRQLFLLR